MGANGSGKSAVLDAIAVGLGAILTLLPETRGRSFQKSDLLFRNGQFKSFMRVTMESTDGIIWDRTETRYKEIGRLESIPKAVGLKMLKQHINNTVLQPLLHNHPYELPVFAYYGVNRAVTDTPKSRKGFPKEFNRFAAYSASLEATNRFRTAFSWFYTKENEEHRLQKEKRSFDVTLPELDTVRRAICTVFKDIREPRIKLNPLRFVVNLNNEEFELTQLSDGYKTLLALVMDLAMRMAAANPDHANPLEVPAFVMIDEVDLHLHPSWQYRVINDLLVTFPNTQFVVTTHSPFIAESINNHLQRRLISEFQVNDVSGSFVNSLLPLDEALCRAYALEDSALDDLYDSESGLLRDHLMQTYNKISHDFELMRDLQWGNR
jgi:predicted ATP-binding protein involved in virulence